MRKETKLGEIDLPANVESRADLQLDAGAGAEYLEREKSFKL